VNDKGAQKELREAIEELKKVSFINLKGIVLKLPLSVS
jgi:hypothetical protein